MGRADRFSIWFVRVITTLTGVICFLIIFESLLHAHMSALSLERASVAEGGSSVGCIHEFPSAIEIASWPKRQKEHYLAAVYDAAGQTRYAWHAVLGVLVLGGEILLVIVCVKVLPTQKR